MIFGYTVSQAKKTVASAVVFILGIVAYFIAFDPSLTTALPLLASALVGVYAVFESRNADAADKEKAVKAALASLAGVISVFTTVDVNTWQTVTTLVLGALNVFLVHQATNAPAPKRRG